MLRKITIISCWLVVLLVLSIGFYNIFILYNSVNKIKKEGVEVEAKIIKKWRGKCGSGYGNSATFEFKIDGKNLKFTSNCNVPFEVLVGDRYFVKYLKEDPSKNIVLFEKKIP